ncbi:MAG: Crp/Fnr family transcriptional regulator [Defluviitaleaceae bacterium]|nr:Crp/Fnr family transcriptional regulator [Defluviitaleaceae bacterium]
MESLQNAVLFTGIQADDCQKLISCLSPYIRHFSKNEIILFSGASIKHIGVILSGTATAYLEHPNGIQTIMSQLKPLSVFGEILVSTRTHKSPVTLYATSDITAAFIEYERLFSICTTACAAHTMLIQNMLKVIGDKYFRLFDRINILREKTLREKILAYLHILSDRGVVSTVTIPFTKTMLADYLLSNRSALSKELRKMEVDGLITVNGRKIKIIASP